MIETPAQLTALKLECIEQVKFYVKKVNEKLSIHMEMPKVIFSISGSTAGRAFLNKNLIAFNPDLLRINIEEFLKRTPGHEVGHLAAHLKFGAGIKPHGHEWTKVMWTLGLPATRCHNYDLSDRAKQQHKPRPIIKTEDGLIKPIGLGKVIEFD